MNTVLRVKNRTAVSVSVVHLVITRPTGRCTARHHERGSDHVPLPRRNANPKFKVYGFY